MVSTYHQASLCNEEMPFFLVVGPHAEDAADSCDIGAAPDLQRCPGPIIQSTCIRLRLFIMVFEHSYMNIWKTALIVITLTVCFATGTNALAELQFGYVDLTGKFVIPAKYASANRFSNDRAIVRTVTSGKRITHVIDHKGREISMDGAVVDAFKDGLAPAKKSGLYGYLNVSGHWEIEPKFQYAWPFDEGMAVVRLANSGKCILIDRGGRVALEFPENFGVPSIKEFSSRGFVWGWLSEGGKRKQIGIFDLRTHQMKLLPKNCEIALDFTEGLAATACSDAAESAGRTLRWGFVNRDGKLQIPASFDQAFLFGSGLAPVRTGNSRFFIDHEGRKKISLPSSCVNVNYFSDGLAAIAVMSKTSWGDKTLWGFIDPTGKVVIPPRFAYSRSSPAPMFVNGFAVVGVEKNDQIVYGMIDKAGKYVLKPEYAFLGNLHEGLAVAAFDRSDPAMREYKGSRP